MTQTDLLKEYPWPSLEIVPLATKDSLEEFINKYALLRTVEIQLVDTNSELDNAGFFDKMRKQKEAIGSTKTALKHVSAKGLNKGEAVTQVSSVTAQGNHVVKLDGKDRLGDRLLGNNEKFKVKTPIGELSDNVAQAGKKMYQSFKSLEESKLVVVPEVSAKVRDKVAEVIKRIK